MAASLKDIVAGTSAKANKSAKSEKPVGYINVRFMDVTVFSRPVWAESTSETPLFAEINELALNEPEKCVELFKALFAAHDGVEIEVSMNRPKSDVSLADVLGALTKK